MSRGMKIYAALLLALGGFIVFNIFYEPSDVRALNATLKQDEQLSSYPYTFRVLRLKDGVATMTSPRSASVPVPMIISVIEPALSGISVNDERFFAAQQRLADMQSRAHTLVTASPDVDRVIWALDEAWLQSQGITLPR